MLWHSLDIAILLQSFPFYNIYDIRLLLHGSKLGDPVIGNFGEYNIIGCKIVPLLCSRWKINTLEQNYGISFGIEKQGHARKRVEESW